MTEKKNKIRFHAPWYIEARVAKAVSGRCQPIELLNAVDCQSCDTRRHREYCVLKVVGDLVSDF